MKKRINKDSLKPRILALLKSERRAMTTEEMVERLFPPESPASRNVKSKMLAAMRHGLIARVAPQTYDLIARVMLGCQFRWVPSRDEIRRGIHQCHFDGEPNILDPSAPMPDESLPRIETELDRIANVVAAFRERGSHVETSVVDGQIRVTIGGRDPVKEKVKEFFAVKPPHVDLMIKQRGDFYYLHLAEGPGLLRALGAPVARLKWLGTSQDYQLAHWTKGKWVNLPGAEYKGELAHCLEALDADAEGLFWD